MHGGQLVKELSRYSNRIVGHGHHSALLDPFIASIRFECLLRGFWMLCT